MHLGRTRRRCSGRRTFHQKRNFREANLRSHHKKKLGRLFEISKDEDFFHLLWAAHFFQSADPSTAMKIFRSGTYHSHAVGPDVAEEHRIHPWELETLANLVLTTPKRFVRKGKEYRLRFDNYQSVVECVNRLRRLEDKEFAMGRHETDIMMEMSRIAQRQFPWQKGFVNAPNIYRNLYVYGQGKCSENFEKAHGISISRFFFVSFALYSSFIRYASISAANGCPQLGVSPSELAKTLKLIALPQAEARKKARLEQRKASRSAYQPSILRQKPCLVFDQEDSRIRSPLPELIIDRISSGLFYDVINFRGSGDDFGRRFENYCLEYLQAMLGQFKWHGEHKYGRKGYQRPTPDVLGMNGDQLQFVFECKARRMSYEAMFKAGPSIRDGIEDIGKGIRQIWTFYADTRKGLTGYSLAPDVYGAVLTMDNWGTMGMAYIDRFFAEAERQIEAEGLDVQPEDRRPVLLFPVQSLERTAAQATPESFLELFALAQSEEFEGWSPEVIHQKVNSFNPDLERAYPFVDKVEELLPWWGKLSKCGRLSP